MGGYRRFWERLLEAAVRRIEYELTKKRVRRSDVWRAADAERRDDEQRGSKPRWGE